MEERRSLVPVVVAMLLALPALYVGSYLAMVQPGQPDIDMGNGQSEAPPTYRFGDGLADRVFWPLEQIDQRLRPSAWQYQSHDKTTG